MWVGVVMDQGGPTQNMWVGVVMGLGVLPRNIMNLVVMISCILVHFGIGHYLKMYSDS